MTRPRIWPALFLAMALTPLGCGEDDGGGSPASPAMTDAGGDGAAPMDAGAPDLEVDACVSRAEECNGIDDDCDGLGDEDLMPPAAERTMGLCGLFFKQCAGPDGWQEPDYHRSPDYQEVEDRCDGQDNDCDGTVDENLSPPPASVTHGVCAGAVQVCDGVLGFTDPPYGEIMGYEALEMTCDALDNDCDGAADEGLAGCAP